MSVNTSKITRRRLRFETIDDLLAELDRIEQANLAGRLTVQGNWSAGQIVSHIAAWVEYGWVGYPVKPPPFFIRWILKFMLKKYLRSGMPAGLRIPGTKEGTFGQDNVPVPQAIDRLRSCLQRLKDGEQARFDSPAFGPMSHEDRIKLNLRHAELHLSFLSF
jgi:Protein of unknown function (DUF1569)